METSPVIVQLLTAFLDGASSTGWQPLGEVDVEQYTLRVECLINGSRELLLETVYAVLPDAHEKDIYRLALEASARFAMLQQLLSVLNAGSRLEPYPREG